MARLFDSFHVIFRQQRQQREQSYLCICVKFQFSCVNPYELYVCGNVRKVSLESRWRDWGGGGGDVLYMCGYVYYSFGIDVLEV